MDAYPFKQRLKEVLKERDKTTQWLAVEIERSSRMIDGISEIDKLTFRDVQAICTALDHDFVAEYYRWAGKELAVPVMNEPGQKYEASDAITINITVRGSAKKSGDLLSKLKQEAERQGYKME